MRTSREQRGESPNQRDFLSVRASPAPLDSVTSEAVSSLAWWLRDPTGTRREIGPRGLLIGRAPDCDIVVAEPEISRHQALVHLEAGEPRLVPLGAASCTVSGKPVDSATNLAEGAQLKIGELQLTLIGEPREEAGPRWLVQMVGGGLYSIAKPRFSIGGGASDDLRSDALGAGAVVLSPAEGFLGVEVNVPNVKVAGRVLEEGDIGSARVGDLVKVGGLALRILAGDSSSAETTRHHLRSEPGATSVSLAFLPRGGRVEMRVAGSTVTVYLAERRCNLVACLLQPPDGFEPGDFVDDDAVIPRVWPNQSKSRTDLNTLLHRVRKDLIGAGVDGAQLIERAEGGGATRFRLQPDATVRID